MGSLLWNGSSRKTSHPFPGNFTFHDCWCSILVSPRQLSKKRRRKSLEFAPNQVYAHHILFNIQSAGLQDRLATYLDSVKAVAWSYCVSSATVNEIWRYATCRTISTAEEPSIEQESPKLPLEGVGQVADKTLISSRASER